MINKNYTSEEEVETLCDRMNSEITSKMKRELEKV